MEVGWPYFPCEQEGDQVLGRLEEEVGDASGYVGITIGIGDGRLLVWEMKNNVAKDSMIPGSVRGPEIGVEGGQADAVKTKVGGFRRRESVVRRWCGNVGWCWPKERRGLIGWG